MEENISNLLNKLKEKLSNISVEFDIDELEQKLASLFSFLYKNADFYKLPFQNVLSIISKTDFTSMGNTANVIISLINSIKDNYSNEDSILLLNSIKCKNNSSFTIDSCIDILKSFPSSQLLSLICHVFDNNKRISIQNYENQIQKLTLENKKLQKQIKKLTKENFHAPLNEEPPDFVDDIFEAAKRGSVESLQYLIENKNVDPNDINEDLNTPLHLACIYSHYNAVRYLIGEAHANPQPINLSGNTPLHYAALYDNLAIVKYFCEPHLVQEIVPNSKNKKGDTPFNYTYRANDSYNSESYKYFVNTFGYFPEYPPSIQMNVTQSIYEIVQNGNFEALRYLVEKNQSIVNENDQFQKKPLYYAILNHNFKIVQYLCENNADINNDGLITSSFPLLVATEVKDIPIIKYLLNKGADINQTTKNQGQTSLHKAASDGSLKVVKFLCQNGSDYNYRDYQNDTPLSLAIKKGHLNVIQYLVEELDVKLTGKYNVFTNEKECPILFCALENKESQKIIQILSYLLTKCPDINERDPKGRTLLHFASYYKFEEVCEYLIQYGFDPNTKMLDGTRLLQTACTNFSFNLIKSLVENYSVPLSDPDDNYPIMCYCFQNISEANKNKDFEIQKYFLEKGYDINTKSKKGETVLHYAAERGHLPIMKMFLDFLFSYAQGNGIQIDINVQSNEGETPLMAACKNPSENPIIKYLIEKGADKNIISNNGLTAFDFIQSPINKKYFQDT